MKRSSTLLSRPAAFLLTGPADAWAWEPQQGLVRLSRPHEEPFAGLECELHRDGRTVTFQSIGGPSNLSQRWSLDLLTGEETELPPISNNEEIYLGPDGRMCLVQNTDIVETQFSRSTYQILLPDSSETIAPSPVPITLEHGLLRLPTTFLRGSNLTGKPLQFSPSGKRLAINFQWAGNPVPATDVVNFDGSFNRRRYGFEVTGSASWNASGKYLLGLQVDVGDTIDRTTTVLDVERNRIVAKLGTPDDPGQTHLGWVGEREVLRCVVKGRNAHLISTDVFSGREEELLDFRTPVAGGDLGVVQLASDVVQSGREAFSR